MGAKTKVILIFLLSVVTNKTNVYPLFDGIVVKTKILV